MRSPCRPRRTRNAGSSWRSATRAIRTPRGPAFHRRTPWRSRWPRTRPCRIKRGAHCLIVHTGDVIYMTGERRLYDRNFRRPYSDFLTPESTVDDLVFRLPFPAGARQPRLLRSGRLGEMAGPRAAPGRGPAGDHARAVRVQPAGGRLGHGPRLHARLRGRQADTRDGALPYRPGERTRLPNRYYTFRVGQVDFFALDSNTLDALPQGMTPAGCGPRPPRGGGPRGAGACPGQSAPGRSDRARALARGAARTGGRRPRAPARAERVTAVVTAVSKLLAALRSVDPMSGSCEAAADAVVVAERRWSEGAPTSSPPAPPPRRRTRCRRWTRRATTGAPPCAPSRTAWPVLRRAARAQILGARAKWTWRSSRGPAPRRRRRPSLPPGCTGCPRKRWMCSASSPSSGGACATGPRTTTGRSLRWLDEIWPRLSASGPTAGASCICTTRCTPPSQTTASVRMCRMCVKTCSRSSGAGPPGALRPFPHVRVVPVPGAPARRPVRYGRRRPDLPAPLPPGAAPPPPASGSLRGPVPERGVRMRHGRAGPGGGGRRGRAAVPLPARRGHARGVARAPGRRPPPGRGLPPRRADARPPRARAPGTRPPWKARLLDHVEIRRGEPPRAQWA